VLTLFHFNPRDQDGQSSQVLILKAQRQTHNTKPSKTKALATTCQQQHCCMMGMSAFLTSGADVLTTMKTTAEYKACKFSGTKLSYESYKVVASIIENSGTS
jgi:hypothetical protein